MNKFILLDDISNPDSEESGALPGPSQRGGARPGAGRKKNVELGDAYTRFNQARAKKEQHNAKLAEFDERERSGELVRADAVLAEWQGIVASVRARLLSLPSKLGPRLYAAQTLGEVEHLLTEGVSEALLELAHD